MRTANRGIKLRLDVVVRAQAAGACVCVPHEVGDDLGELLPLRLGLSAGLGRGRCGRHLSFWKSVCHCMSAQAVQKYCIVECFNVFDLIIYR